MQYIEVFITDFSDKYFLLRKILKLVCKKEGISESEIKSKNRNRNFVDARYIYFTLARAKVETSLQKIGKVVNSDHSTVLHGLKQVKEIKELKNKINNYERSINLRNNV